DDKIIEKAIRSSKLEASATKIGGSAYGGESSKLEEKVEEISRKYLDAYHEAMAILGIARPDKEPKATEYIPKMVKFIGVLIKKGRAYEAGGDVYFDINKADNYGKLSNQVPGKMEAGARISPGENKKDPLDFALWKKAKTGEPSWPSPWGAGRPGWHIECSAMSSDILGDEFDIHGGGIDLIFPHHENEIAQSEGAGKKFAKYWVHNGLLTIKNEKMAKSAGNFVTIKDFIAGYKDPDYLKLLFLNTHYRHPVDYTDEKIGEMKSQKERLQILAAQIGRKLSAAGCRLSGKGDKRIEKIKEKFIDAMDDDFNMPQGLAYIFELALITNKNIDDVEFISQAKGALFELLAVFGLELCQKTGAKDLGMDVKVLINKRAEARKKGDFKEADTIRIELEAQGIILEDTKDGTIWRQRV
ncbi:MAG: cysteine--tRNA ligase, partial [Candidatus Omnitrophota bacterium]|nr:cysteine--tRNA ligase [Candidatus Omnitrophota bacterium]